MTKSDDEQRILEQQVREWTTELKRSVPAGAVLGVGRGNGTKHRKDHGRVDRRARTVAIEKVDRATPEQWEAFCSAERSANPCGRLRAAGA